MGKSIYDAPIVQLIQVSNFMIMCTYMFVLCLAVYYNKHFVAMYVRTYPYMVFLGCHIEYTTIVIIRMFIYLLMLGLTVCVNKYVATYVMILYIIFIVL